MPTVIIIYVHGKNFQILGIPFQAHINAAETKRLAELGQKYRNPYNFGPAHNWHLFLGNLPQISDSNLPQISNVEL